MQRKNPDRLENKNLFISSKKIKTNELNKMEERQIKTQFWAGKHKSAVNKIIDWDFKFFILFMQYTI